MRGLTILCDDGARLGTAMDLLLAQGALGGPAHLFLAGPAVGAATQGDHALNFADAQALGVRFSVCQTALANQGLTLKDLPAGFAGLGPVGLLAGLGEDRLIVL